LGLCYEEIVNNQVKGSVAELGIYKGDFAWRLNFLFADRTLYLFDTFSGFDAKDLKQEVSNGFQQVDQDFSDTSVDMVLSKMINPKKCIVRKGYFPDTTIGIDDTFCFVSIDADLYGPILTGLNYFYPRLEKGGYLFIHDFNNDMYKGANEAVLKFCAENKIGYVPIPDSGGTVIIAK
jgi:O-methyltransferase